MSTIKISKRSLTFVAIAALLTGAVAGCSSGSDASRSTDSTSAPPPQLPGGGHGSVKVAAGTYAVFVHGSPRPGTPTPVIRVPAGYRSAGFAVNAGVGATGHTVAPGARGLSFWEVGSVMSDPCKAGKHGINPGPSVADLAQALSDQPLRAGSDPAPVTVAGYHGLYVETSVPAHIDFAKCEDGYFDSWISTDDGGRYQLGPGQRDRLWILNVNGYRLVIDGWHMPTASQAQIDEITGMVNTLTIPAG
jgi:hypothetical protein